MRVLSWGYCEYLNPLVGRHEKRKSNLLTFVFDKLLPETKLVVHSHSNLEKGPIYSNTSLVNN
jgi:hypothetical protein